MHKIKRHASVTNIQKKKLKRGPVSLRLTQLLKENIDPASATKQEVSPYPLSTIFTVVNSS